MTILCQPGNATPLALPYGSLALALYAAPDLPYPTLPAADDLATIAQHGIDRLGGVEHVQQLHQQWLDLNGDLLSGQRSLKGYRDAMRAWLQAESPWVPADLGRLDRCLGLDFSLRRAD